MITPKEFNEIIYKMWQLEEKDLPYCKGMVAINDIIRILRSYQQTQENGK